MPIHTLLLSQLVQADALSFSKGSSLGSRCHVQLTKYRRILNICLRIISFNTFLEEIFRNPIKPKIHFQCKDFYINFYLITATLTSDKITNDFSLHFVVWTTMNLCNQLLLTLSQFSSLSGSGTYTGSGGGGLFSATGFAAMGYLYKSKLLRSSHSVTCSYEINKIKQNLKLNLRLNRTLCCTFHTSKPDSGIKCVVLNGHFFRMISG